MKTTQMSLKALRADGYSAAVVEHWNMFAHIRQDLFQWIDIVAVCAKIHGVLGVQTTSYPNMRARVNKAKGNVALRHWLNCGGRLEVHGWRKVKNRYQCEVIAIRAEDLNE